MHVAKSVSGVTLSGPKLETVVVTLIDGTQFGISGEINHLAMLILCSFIFKFAWIPT